MNLILIILFSLSVIWIISSLLENFKIRVYIVWAIDDAEKEVTKFLGVTFTENSAKKLIHQDQIERWRHLEKDKWKVEWRYDPIFIVM